MARDRQERGKGFGPAYLLLQEVQLVFLPVVTESAFQEAVHDGERVILVRHSVVVLIELVRVTLLLCIQEFRSGRFHDVGHVDAAAVILQ